MPAGVIEQKAALRRHMGGLPEPDWAPMLQRFLSLPELENSQTVMLFYGVKGEPDTRVAINELLQRGKRVVLPRCIPERQMQARFITKESILLPGAYGIPEPGEDCPLAEKKEIDLVLVPNLCCDKSGFRLGHGGGYYDRFLTDFPGVSVALCPEERLAEQLPAEETDIPVDIVLTQRQTRRRAAAPRRIWEESAAIK